MGAASLLILFACACRRSLSGKHATGLIPQSARWCIAHASPTLTQVMQTLSFPGSLDFLLGLFLFLIAFDISGQKIEARRNMVYRCCRWVRDSGRNTEVGISSGTSRAFFRDRPCFLQLPKRPCNELIVLLRRFGGALQRSSPQPARSNFDLDREWHADCRNRPFQNLPRRSLSDRCDRRLPCRRHLGEYAINSVQNAPPDVTHCLKRVPEDSSIVFPVWHPRTLDRQRKASIMSPATK